jgi:hypothetical protein
MTYYTPTAASSPEIIEGAAGDADDPTGGYRGVFPTPNTGVGGLLQSDVWFINTLIAWSGYDSYLYDENIGITFHERVDANADGKITANESDEIKELVKDLSVSAGLLNGKEKTAYQYNSEESYRPEAQYNSENDTAAKIDEPDAVRFAYDVNGEVRSKISFQPVAKLSELDFMTDSGKLNDTLSISTIMNDTTGFRNRIYSYLRVVEASEHKADCVDPKCQGCATPDISGDSFVRYNNVGFHEIVCYDLDDDPNTVCDKELKNCPYHYTKNGNQRVITSRPSNLSNDAVSTAITIERVSRNSFWQAGQNDSNATQYRWAEIDMGDWGTVGYEAINWAATDAIETLVVKSRAEVARLSAVLKPGDIILTDNRLDINGRLLSDAEYIVWTGSRLVESMYPQFDYLTGSAAAYIGTTGGTTGPCIMNLASFEGLPNYATRAENWTVFRCVTPEQDTRYRTAGLYMAQLTQKFMADYYNYKLANPDDFGDKNGYGK